MPEIDPQRTKERTGPTGITYLKMLQNFDGVTKIHSVRLSALRDYDIALDIVNHCSSD